MSSPVGWFRSPEPFTTEQLSAKIAELLLPEGIHAEVEIIYQSIAGLHNACPNNKGDWYFTGNYPTPGGVKVVNRAFMNFMEKIVNLLGCSIHPCHIQYGNDWY